MHVTPVTWEGGRLFIIDQTLLPGRYEIIPLDTLHAVFHAIRTLQVRGAPAIGVCAAFGLLVALKEKGIHSSVGDVKQCLHDAAEFLARSRPTAVNLFWALNRMKQVADREYASVQELLGRLEAEAVEILNEDTRRCRAIGRHGAELIPHGAGVLTHCNAGALATSSYGTALAVLYAAKESGKEVHVFADETRPLLQGARLTAWELTQAGIDVTLICDSAAAHVMQQEKIDAVLVGADRIAANGDTANKIGTYGLALAAQAHRIPFYVAAPLSTLDLSLPHGGLIPIEERSAEEVTGGFARPVAPDGIRVYNPAFDVTPAHLITGIITECGVLRPPFDRAISACMKHATSPKQTRTG